MYTERRTAAGAEHTGEGARTTMRTIRQDRYGPPDVLELAEVDTPVPGDGEVLLAVAAAAANPLDWHFMRGEPYVMRLSTGLRGPKNEFRGVDVAGHVEAVGATVTRFQPGDPVVGWCESAFSEYVCIDAEHCLPVPDDLSLVEAAATPLAAITALQALRDQGALQGGQSVLINGASGGVGTFAVQIAGAYGAAVTGVCSTRNLEMVRSLGADHVVDYTEDDFARRGERYDLVLDLVGNRSLSDLRRAVTAEGTLVLSGGEGGPWIGPLGLALRSMVTSPFVSQRLRSFVADQNREDLAVLCDLVESGDVSPVIDRTYPLSETAEAIRYLEKGHARGKVVVTTGDEDTGGG